jgi:hypothetical protein
MITFPNNVQLYHLPAPFSTLEQWTPVFAEKYVKPRDKQLKTQRIENIYLTSLFAFLPPLGILLFGWALMWAYAGFYKAKS